MRYIAFGDSATSGADGPGFPARLDERIGSEGARVTNEGRGGEVTEDGLERLASLLAEERYPNATVLLYWEGGNDVTEFIRAHDPFLLNAPDAPGYPLASALAQRLDRTQANIEAAIRLAWEYGLDVYVATYYPISAEAEECDPLPFNVILPSQAERANVYVDGLNARIRRAATNEGVFLVDVATELGPTLSSNVRYYEDCNHLSAAGDALVAEFCADALR